MVQSLTVSFLGEFSVPIQSTYISLLLFNLCSLVVLSMRINRGELWRNVSSYPIDGDVW